MLMRLGEPSMLFMKFENPLFFLKTVPLFGPLASSEYLFGLVVPFSDRGGVTSIRSPAEKLEDCRKEGLITRVSGLVWESGGGGGRRREL